MFITEVIVDLIGILRRKREQICDSAVYIYSINYIVLLHNWTLSSSSVFTMTGRYFLARRIWAYGCTLFDAVFWASCCEVYHIRWVIQWWCCSSVCAVLVINACTIPAKRCSWCQRFRCKSVVLNQNRTAEHCQDFCVGGRNIMRAP